MGGLFSDVTDTIFLEKEVLDEEYQPDEILEREDEINEYKSAFTDVLFGRNPSNVMLYGKAGVGKTAVTRYVLEELKTETEDREDADDLYVHRHNCNGDTMFSAVRTLVNGLLPEESAQFPKKGLSRADALEEFYAQLERLGGTHLVVLDEIDHLQDANELLYELPRARANDYITSARIGIIGISNNYTFRQHLSAKVQDALKEEEISFSTYDANELRAILHTRAEKALSEESYSDSAIAKAAAVAGRDTGSARQAIDLLRKGAEIAEENDEPRVKDDHIELAREAVKRGRLQDKIKDQSLHARLVLEAVAKLDHVGETPARSKAIMKTYRRVARKRAEEPLTTLKSIQNHLSDLYMLGFLLRSEENEGRKGGSYHEYDLDMDANVVFEVCDQLDNEDAV